jgi:SAM-dependent methyltransferase
MSDPPRWPKVRAPLTTEEELIWEDFYTLWHEVLPRRYRVIERFNQRFATRFQHAGVRTTIEIGAGMGGHLDHERPSPEKEGNYYAVELRESLAGHIRKKYPRVNVVIGSCEDNLPFEDNSFDRGIAVHVLEHLPNLPVALQEMRRVLNKQRGQLLAVIPCEGGQAYSLARRVSAKSVFEAAYDTPYAPFIAREHLNRPHEILSEIERCFTVVRKRFYPFPFLPRTSLNLCIGLVLRPRPMLPQSTNHGPVQTAARAEDT